MIYVNEIIELYTLNLYTAVCQLYVNKTGGQGDINSQQWPQTSWIWSGRRMAISVLRNPPGDSNVPWSLITNSVKVLLDLTSLGSSEQAMASHSSTLAWKIPWTEEPGRLESMRSLRVGQDWATSLSLFTFMHWRRKWQPTPVFLPGESQGRGSLVGCRLWGHTESDTTEVT